MRISPHQVVFRRFSRVPFRTHTFAAPRDTSSVSTPNPLPSPRTHIAAPLALDDAESSRIEIAEHLLGSAKRNDLKSVTRALKDLMRTFSQPQEKHLRNLNPESHFQERTPRHGDVTIEALEASLRFYSRECHRNAISAAGQAGSYELYSRVDSRLRSMRSIAVHLQRKGIVVNNNSWLEHLALAVRLADADIFRLVLREMKTLSLPIPKSVKRQAFHAFFRRLTSPDAILRAVHAIQSFRDSVDVDAAVRSGWESLEGSLASTGKGWNPVGRMLGVARAGGGVEGMESSVLKHIRDEMSVYISGRAKRRDSIADNPNAVVTVSNANPSQEEEVKEVTRVPVEEILKSTANRKTLVELSQALKQRGVPRGKNLLEVLIYTHSLELNIDAMMEAFGDYRDEGYTPSVGIMNWILRSFTISGDEYGVADSMQAMEMYSIYPNQATYTLLLRFFCERKIETVDVLINHMNSLGFSENDETGAAVLSLYSALGNQDGLLNKFHEYQSIGISDVSCWNVLIDFIARNSTIDDAFSALDRMIQAGVQPSESTVILLVRACIAKANVRGLAQTLEKALDVGVEVSPVVFARVAECLIDTGAGTELRGLLLLMKDRNIPRDASLYQVAIPAFCSLRDGEAIADAWHDMYSECLVGAWERWWIDGTEEGNMQVPVRLTSNDDVLVLLGKEEGESNFNPFKSNTPLVVHILEGLGLNGQTQIAKKVVREVDSSGIDVDFYTFALLSAFRE